MTFPDLGRMMLDATIRAWLGDQADTYDVAALVNAFVDEFGFVDVDEVEPSRFWELVHRFG